MFPQRTIYPSSYKSNRRMHEGQENKTLPESWPGRQLVVQVGIDGHPLDGVALAGRGESALGSSDKGVLL